MNVIVFGAHPDDCEYYAGGTAALWTGAGHRVRFVSLTNGEAGHHEIHGEALAARRRAEAAEAARRGGVSWAVLDHRDGRLLPTLVAREQVIREIRTWRADLVLGHRPYDYHPDHRAAAALVQDAAFLVMVPHIAPEVPPLRRNPVFLYMEDDFRRPLPFSPDIVVAIDETVDRKIAMLDAHASQFYEWLPWLSGDPTPVPEASRRAWLVERWLRTPGAETREALARWYGSDRAEATRYAEAFEICEYGSRPSEARIRELFPFLRPGSARPT